MSSEGTFFCVIPSYRPVGGVIKALDYTLHARSHGLAARVVCPQPFTSDSSLLEIPGFEQLRDDPQIEKVHGLEFAPLPHDWVLFSLPSQWPAIAERLPANFPSHRIIHVVQGVRHGTPSWQDGFPTRLLTRPMTRVAVSEPVLSAIRPHLNSRSRTTLIPLGHRTEYFNINRVGLNRPIRVGYTTWKSDIGKRVEARLSDDDRFVFDSIEGAASWEKLRRFYQGADVFLSSPLEEEGFYLPGLEAMAAGALVVTPDVHGNQAYCRFGENCVEVPYENDEAYVLALMEIAGWDDSRVTETRRLAWEEVSRHRLEHERDAFHSLLSDLNNKPIPAPVSLYAWERQLRHQPSPCDLLFTGVPRSGTTLVTHLFNQLPDVVALSEPLRPGLLMREPSVEAVVDRIVDFFAEQRSRIREEGIAESRTVHGEDPDNYFEESAGDGQVRRYIAENSELQIDRQLGEEFTLVVKDVVMLAALLPMLTRRFSVYGMVRNPLAVLASWNSVQFNMRMGRSPHAEWFDPDLGRILAGMSNRFDRQMALLSWWFERIREGLPAEQVVRYEDVVGSDGKSLSFIVPSAANLDATLRSRNTNSAYDVETMQDCAKRLLASDGAYWEFYETEDVEALLDEMSSVTEL